MPLIDVLNLKSTNTIVNLTVDWKSIDLKFNLFFVSYMEIMSVLLIKQGTTLSVQRLSLERSQKISCRKDCSIHIIF